MNAAAPSLRMIHRDEIMSLIESLRENDPARAWPSVRQAQTAVRNTWRIGVGSDRMRGLLAEARAADLPTDTEADGTRVTLADRTDRIHAQAARAARIRRRRARLLATGDLTEREDNVRRLLTEAVQQGSRGGRVEAVVEPLMGRFLAAEIARAALLRDEPTPTTDAAPSEAAPVAPEAEPDTAPDMHPDDLPPLPLKLAIAEAQASGAAPGAEPDPIGFAAKWINVSAPDTEPDVDSNDQASLATSAPDAAPDDLAFLTH